MKEEADLEYVDDENDEDWSYQRRSRRSVRNARRWQHKPYKQENNSRTGAEHATPDQAQAMKCENGDWRCSVCDKISSIKQNIMGWFSLYYLFNNCSIF